MTAEAFNQLFNRPIRPRGANRKCRGCKSRLLPHHSGHICDACRFDRAYWAEKARTNELLEWRGKCKDCGCEIKVVNMALGSKPRKCDNCIMVGESARSIAAQVGLSRAAVPEDLARAHATYIKVKRVLKRTAQRSEIPLA